MPRFDPRRRPMRFAPHVLTALAAVSVAGLVWHVYQPEAKPEANLTPEAVAELEAKAFAAAAAPAGMNRPETVKVKVERGDTLETALRRTGVAAEEAAAAVATLAGEFDPVRVRAGMTFDAAVARPREGRGSARLIGLTLRSGPAETLTVSRSFDGAMRLRALEERIVEETHVAAGEIHGSLFESAARLGANSATVSRTVKLFAQKIDFQRDIKAGDEFVMVFDRKVTESGRIVDTGELAYAELKGQRFYRFQAPGMTEAQYFDEFGKNIRGFLLRTPVDGARMSSGFGMRRHPILGFQKMHQGIDFAAPTGTPVVAAGDGVVVEARRWGGYGNWVRVRHANGYETGYAHLSRFAKGLRPGAKVRQGQVIAYVGSTGRSTGPHLHHEVWLRGKRVNPKGAKIPSGTILAGRDLAAFKLEKARIDSLVAERARRTDSIQVASIVPTGVSRAE